MLGDRRLRQRNLVDDFPAMTFAPSGEQSQNLNSRRMAQGLGEVCQLPIGLLPFSGAKVRRFDIGWTWTGGLFHR